MWFSLTFTSVSIFPVLLFSLLHAATYTKKVLDVSMLILHNKCFTSFILKGKVVIDHMLLVVLWRGATESHMVWQADNLARAVEIWVHWVTMCQSSPLSVIYCLLGMLGQNSRENWEPCMDQETFPAQAAVEQTELKESIGAFARSPIHFCEYFLLLVRQWFLAWMG